MITGGGLNASAYHGEQGPRAPISDPLLIATNVYRCRLSTVCRSAEGGVGMHKEVRGGI